MANVHTPERQPGESQQQYRKRRMASNRAAERIAGRGLSGGINSRQQHRDSMRASGSMSKRRRFADNYTGSVAAKRITKAKHRDEHGAYTCVGSTYEVEGMAPNTNREHVTSSWVHGEDMGYTARRKWLAGVSAQRGY